MWESNEEPPKAITEDDLYCNESDVSADYIPEYATATNPVKCTTVNCKFNATRISKDSRHYCSIHIINCPRYTNNYCIIVGCLTHASQGLEMGKPIYCKKHSDLNCYGVTNKRCGYDNCIIRPSYGFANTDNPIMIRCSAHREDGMTLLANKVKCAAQGCNKHGYYHDSINDLVLYCFTHSSEDMVLKKYSRQTHCRIRKQKFTNNRRRHTAHTTHTTRTTHTVPAATLTLKNFIISEKSKANYALMRARP